RSGRLYCLSSIRAFFTKPVTSRPLLLRGRCSHLIPSIGCPTSSTKLARARNCPTALLSGTCPSNVQDRFRKRRYTLVAAFQVFEFSCSESRLFVGNFQKSFFPDVFV